MSWYVATLARYVLVEAENDEQAREKGLPALHELYADVRARLGHDVPINILTVRPATREEIELRDWHEEMLARERS